MPVIRKQNGELPAKPTMPKVRRNEHTVQWWRTHQAVTLATRKLMLGNPYKVPSYQDIANETGFSLDTIARHFQEFNIDRVRELCKIYLTEGMMAVAQKMMETGDLASLKFFAQGAVGMVDESKRYVEGEIGIQDLRKMINDGSEIVEEKDQLEAENPQLTGEITTTEEPEEQNGPETGEIL